MPDPLPARRTGKPGIYDALFGDLPEGMLPTPARPDAPLPNINANPGQRVSAWRLSGGEWFRVLKGTVRAIGDDRVTSVAGGVSYFGLLSLFPALTALVSMYGWVADESTIIDSVALLERLLPSSAVELISGQIAAIVSAPTSALSFAGIIGILAALWTANGGMKAMIEALNVAWFESERRGFVWLNIVSLALTLGAIGLIILMILTITVLPIVANLLTPDGSPVEGMINLLRWPLLFGVLLLSLAFLYRFGPSKKDPAWQWISPGAFFAAVGLVVASVLFSWYASNFGNYNETYGSLGAVVVLLVWLWISAIIVLVGAELNSEIERHLKIKHGVPPQSTSDKR